MSKILTHEEQKQKLNRSKKIKFLYKKELDRLSSDLDQIRSDSYLDLFIKSINNSVYTQTKSCYFIHFTETASMFDLRNKYINEVSRLLKNNYKNLIVIDRFSIIVYK